MTSSDGRPPALEADLAARRAAQTVFDRPLVLEAGAGTGKTTTLVARLLAWTLGAGWERTAAAGEEGLEDERIAARVLEGVVAITFTEAAAAEMALRLGRRLADIAGRGDLGETRLDPELLQPGPLSGDELAKRALALLAGLERVTICTIHAFCNLLLRRHALTLGLHPDFRIDAREDLSEEVAREAVERATRRAYAAGESAGEANPLLRLAARGLGSRRLVEAVTRFVAEGIPAATFTTSPFTPDRLVRAHGELTAAVEALWSLGRDRLLEVTRGDLSRRVHAALEATLRFLEERPFRDLQSFAEALEELAAIWSDESARGRLGDWERNKFNQSEGAAFGDAQEEMAAAAGDLRRMLDLLLALDPEFLDEARQVLHPLLVEVESELRARGIATFQSLLDDCRALLDDDGVRRRERRRIDQLLVDEFQDTDDTQCEIVSRLALQGPPQDRPGLFVVGDPKQSIYAWRNADLGAYQDLVDRAVAAGGELHRLSRNFRSAPEILAEVERAVAPVMIERRGLQPPFEPLLAGGEPPPTGFASDSDSPVEYWVSWDRRKIDKGWTSSQRAAAIEARAIAADIERLHDEHQVPFNDFAVLLRTASRLDDFLEAFRAAGIPFAVTGDRQYYRRREVIEAAALVRAVVRPHDHLALVSFLRSPTVGVPDAAWLPLWKHRLPALVTELGSPADEARLEAAEKAILEAAAETPAVDGLPTTDGRPAWTVSLGAALRTLATLRQTFRKEPADRFIESLRTRFMTEATEAARYLGVYRVANLERFFRRLEEGLGGGHGEIDMILRALRRSVAEAREDEEALPRAAAAAAVQVMTIHKAKGLEFEHVYLPQLHAGGPQSEHQTHDADRRVTPGEDREYVLFGLPSLGWERVEARRVESAAAEQVRTLYVAMTRACRRLVLIGSWSRKTTPFSGVGVPKPVKLLYPRAPFPGSMPELAGAIEDPEQGWLDEHGVRWKIPDLAATDRDTARTPARRQTAPPPVEQVRDWAAQLAADRATSKDRMDRRILTTASDLAGSDRGGPEGGGRHRKAADALPRAAALTAGKVIHRALETWDLEAPKLREWEAQRRGVLAAVGGAVDPAVRDRAVTWCQELMERFRDGALLPRLRSAAASVVARELPILLRSQGSDGPLAAYTGTIDLLLSEDDSGSLLVVDYKTDDITSQEAIGRRAALYQPQLRIYAQALEGALALDRPVRAELWFLWPGVAHPLEPGAKP